MSGQYLNAITENASRLGMRLQESFSEHTRDLSISRTSNAIYLEGDDKAKDIRRQLDSNSDREKLDAMKRLIAFISKGRNVSEYFAQVVKNVASQNLEIRKLVYIYLLRYAEQEPDLALLSINTFQKDLTDSNPLIRAMALRVLSGIKVPMIGSLVVLAIKKCAADISPYVRKGAALAIPKCFELDSSHLPSLIGIITTLLSDRSPLSIGSVAVAFESVCPTRLDLLHQQYRRLCKILVDADEWGQVELMNLLLRYVRTMLPRPIAGESGEELDKDVKLLLTSTEPLFQSRNPSVVVAVARIFFYAGPPSQLSKIVQPLLRLLSNGKQVERVVLVYFHMISRTAPNLFAPFYTRFLVRTDDLRQVKQDKIKLLLNIINVDNHSAILREFIDYTDDADDAVVSDAIQGIGKCARLIPESTQQCLNALMSMIKGGHDVVVSGAVLVLKYLVQIQLATTTSFSFETLTTSQSSPITIISHLARKIDDIRHAQARACVLWLVGQYSASTESGPGPEGVSEWAPDVLRKVAKTFAQENPIVKVQAITLAAKLFVLSPHDKTLTLLSQYVFSLARYDLNYDVRDRARMMSSLLAGVAPTSLVNGVEQEPRAGVVLRREQVKLVLFEGKSGHIDDQATYIDHGALVGSLSMVTGKPMYMDRILPDWLERGVQSSLRDVDEPAPLPAPVALSSAQIRAKGVASPIVLTPGGGSSPVGSQSKNGVSKGPWKDLDKFYEEEDVEGEDDDDDDDDDEDDDEDEDDEEDEGDEEGEEGGEEDDEEEGDGEEDSDSANAVEVNTPVSELAHTADRLNPS